MKIEGLPYINQASMQSINRDSKADSFARTLEAAQKDDKELYKTCQELESVFISKVLDSMRAAIPRSDFISRGFADDVFESMLYDEYAQKISQTNSIGLAQILYQQLSRQ